jgi:hypothetical protein
LAEEISEQRALLGCGKLQTVLHSATHLVTSSFWHHHT